ncbi:hypothetical protein ACJMK2_018479 [Sinanodonta woodiana]|uniref:Anaphase-promoting complex subunit 4-like WD40 domain-containing protein n=1 Tax=Sinanodonta woodiana TaxID=1069815 RepID=A0ABD3UFL4_SINWO
MTTLSLSGGHTGSVLCVDASPDGSYIASGAENGEICLWKRDGTLVHKLVQDQNDCTSVFLSRVKENILYSAVGDTVYVYDLLNFQNPIDTFKYNEEEINQIQLGQNETFLAACDDSGQVKIINLQEKNIFKTLRRKHTNICSSVCFHPRKPWDIFTGGMDCNLIHWDFSRPKCKNQFNMQELQDTPLEMDAYMVNPPFIHHLTASPDGKFLAVALENGQVSLFDMSRKNIFECFTLLAHAHGASQVHFISDSRLVSGGNDSVIALWDINNPNELADVCENLPSNGHPQPLQQRDVNYTEVCKLGQITLTSKINWLKPFVCAGENFIAVANQSSSLTVLPLNLL